MSQNDITGAWKRHWDMGGSLEENASWLGRRLRKRRIEIMREMLKPLRKDMKVIDLGCGNGSTLKVLRDCGFRDSVGLEFIDSGLEHAQRNGFTLGVDVFKGDAGDTKYPDKAFDLVFSEGLWEHFKDPSPYIMEFARISGRYIMVIQPNHFSVVGFLMKVGWDVLNSKKGGVKEYSFRLEYFESSLKTVGFRLIQKKSTRFNEQAVMLFERVE